jgi:hypothetical protein
MLSKVAGQAAGLKPSGNPPLRDLRIAACCIDALLSMKSIPKLSEIQAGFRRVVTRRPSSLQSTRMNSSRANNGAGLARKPGRYAKDASSQNW